MIHKVGRIAALVLLFVLGVAAGAVGAFVQAAYLPAGLIVALAGCGGLFVAGGALLGAKSGALVPGAGWLLSVLYLAATTRPEGDWVFASGFSSYVYLLGGTIIGVSASTMPWGGSGPFILPSETRSVRRS